MKIITTPQEMSIYAKECHKKGLTLGLVPTMGALHEGHLALIDAANSIADCTVVSIFVNPIQFNEATDFEKYPRTFDKDCAAAQRHGAQVIFAPTTESMYPKGFDTIVHLNGITEPLEGAARPGHFDGVTTVVLKLFTASLADFAIFGQKDAQQLLVIKKMVSDLNIPIEIVAHPTIREESGLARSSRNTLLTSAERHDVPRIYEGLLMGKALFDKGEYSTERIRKAILMIYEQSTLFEVEYIAFSDHSCKEITALSSDGGLISVACRCKESNVRLIDNIPLGSFWS